MMRSGVSVDSGINETEASLSELKTSAKESSSPSGQFDTGVFAKMTVSQGDQNWNLFRDAVRTSPLHR